jgi:cytochrome b6-f complex iron-sulfur subunit
MSTQPVTCGLSRRALLGGAGVLGASFALAACAGSAAGPAANGSAATTAPPPTPAGPPGVLVALENVPVGTGVIAPGPVLVLRSSADEVKAYDAVCPHQRITIGTPDVSGTITCPGHGARFSAADGKVLSGPAPSGLRPIAVDVQDGLVVRA